MAIFYRAPKGAFRSRPLFNPTSNAVFKGLLLLIASIALISCGNQNSAESELTKMTLRVGVSPGPYNDLFNDAVKPILEREGYTVKLVNFSNLLESNIGTIEKGVDLTVAQHSAYMKVFNKERNAHLKPVVAVPSVPAAIYSDKYDSLDAVTPKMKIAIPQDPSNAARAYNLLAKAGWITLKESDSPLLVTRNDITSNPLNLEIIEVDSATIPRIMIDIDYAVIPGSIVYSAGIPSEKGLLQESIIPELEILVVVNEGMEQSDWAKAIKRIYQSEEFFAYMDAHNQNHYWVLAQTDHGSEE